MADFSLSGLATGLDSKALIDQLMALERQPRTRMERSERQVTERQSLLRQINTRLTSLRTAATDLRSSTVWADTQSVDTADTTKLAARRTGNAGVGGYQIDVVKLARAEQRTFDFTADAAERTLTIEGASVTIGAAATVAQAAEAINASSAMGVYAAALDGRLVLTAKASGAAAGGDPDGKVFAADTPGMLSEVVASARAGQDTEIRVDGVTRTSSTNVLAGAIPGLEITVKAVGSTAVTVGAPGPDKAAVKAKVKAFVDQYNAALDFVRTELQEKRVASPTTTAQESAGVLRSDAMLEGVLRQLRTAVSDSVPGGPAGMDELWEIGVSTGATTGSSTPSKDAISGRLVFDEAKLDAAIASDMPAVRRLLGATSGIDGISQRLDAAIEPLTRSDGALSQRIGSADTELKRVRDSMAALDTRLAQREKRFREMFTRLETLVSASQAQGAWLTGQINSLNRS